MSPKRRSSAGSLMPATEMMRKSVCSQCGCSKVVVNGAYLRAKRVERQISLREVARHAKLSVAFLSDVELNRRNVTGRVLDTYAEAGIIDLRPR